MKPDRYAQVLMDLGLTLLQAQVYLALVKFGKAEAKNISSTINIARGDVYRVMASLEKLGLAEKVILTPTTFQATPLREGYELLLQNKEKEYSTLKDEAIEAMNSTPEKEELSSTNDQQFIMISSESLFIEKIKAEKNHSTRSIKIAGSWKSINAIEFYQSPIHEKALKRGVKINLLTERHAGAEFEKIYPSLFKYGHQFEIRYTDPPIPVRVGIFDDERLIISTRKPTDSEITPAMWSNNQQIVRAITAYFDQSWKAAKQSIEP